ncbi:MAG TPA: hypothetical protein VGK16_00225 [Candidatus Limnocylindrales bacterium]|jgi:KDO2-lipid IV(A) lauroyltransferase
MTAPTDGSTAEARAERPPRPGVRGSAIMGAAWLAARLPASPLVAGADAAGELWYRTAPVKRAQARANLQRACEGLAESGRGPARARRAATDPQALERLVRATFRHAARYYLEVLRSGAFDLESALALIDIESPDEVRDALRSGRPVVVVGMHYGAIELPVILLSSLVGHAVTAPMETVADPGLAHWFRTSRSRVGVNVVSITGARRALLRAIRRGESVGLVADRDLTHNGMLVPFFGHPTPIAAGPALLALETGVPIYAASARRLPGGRYAGRMMLVPEPTEGTRRERVLAYTAAIAAAFESILADGPEQWWGSFHPIWPDLAVETGEVVAPGDRA